MTTILLPEKYEAEMHGVLNCYDRLIISGYLRPLSYEKGITSFLYQHQIRIFDYKHFAQPLRDIIRDNADAIAQENGLEIEFIRKSKRFRKEKRIQKILKTRGHHPGLVHIFSAMEQCTAYYPWHDKQTHHTFLKSKQSRCLHYYFYFIDEELGLCYLRVPTWCPFRLQFYCNGHNLLASQLQQEEIEFQLLDNAFLEIADFDRANLLAANLDIQWLHAKLDYLAQRYCLVTTILGLEYSWSIMQAEYATDLVFKDPDTLQAFYPHLLEALIRAVKPADVAIFLGRKLHGNYQGELDIRLNKRWLGSRIKHQMGPVSIKMYDKFGIVLRIEVTVNDVSFFKQYRQVYHRDGSRTTKWAPK